MVQDPSGSQKSSLTRQKVSCNTLQLTFFVTACPITAILYGCRFNTLHDTVIYYTVENLLSLAHHLIFIPLSQRYDWRHVSGGENILFIFF